MLNVIYINNGGREDSSLFERGKEYLFLSSLTVQCISNQEVITRRSRWLGKRLLRKRCLQRGLSRMGALTDMDPLRRGALMANRQIAHSCP
jgi:hypothetical protein